MAKYCSDCTYFNTKDKKGEGFCKCSKNKKYVLANSPRCDKFSEAYSRKWYEREKLYDAAKDTMNKYVPSKMSVGSYAIIAVILIVLAIIVNVFK